MTAVGWEPPASAGGAGLQSSGKAIHSEKVGFSPGFSKVGKWVRRTRVRKTRVLKVPWDRTGSLGGAHLDRVARLGRSCGQDPMVDGKEGKLEPIGNARFVVNAAQIVLDHLFGGAQPQRNLFILAALHDQDYDLNLFRGKPVAHARAYGILFL